MRRLVQHALAGVGAAALAAGVAVSGVGAPDGATLAVPAPATSVGSTPAADPTGHVESPAVAAERAARQAEQDRSQEQAQQAAAALAQAAQRSAALQDQSRSITRQHAKIVADRKAAARAAAARAARLKAERARAAKARAAAVAAARAARAAREAAERARQEQIRQLGYEPGTTDPRDMARQILQNTYGYGPDQYSCFNDIIIRESNWDIDATNPSSGAYGIPQALPASKMASAGSDWRTNPATQITWAIGYMKDRYGSPCQAWDFKRSHGWY